MIKCENGKTYMKGSGIELIIELTSILTALTRENLIDDEMLEEVYTRAKTLIKENKLGRYESTQVDLDELKKQMGGKDE